jgi:hypothetical protein
MNLNRILKTGFTLAATAFAAPLLLSSGAAAQNVRVGVDNLTGLQSVCTKNKGELFVANTGDCQTWVGPSDKEDIETLTFADENNDTQTVIGNGGITTRTRDGSSSPREDTFSVDSETGDTFVGGTLTVEEQTTTNGIDNNGQGITNAGDIGTGGGNINTNGGDIDAGSGSVNASNVNGQNVSAAQSFSVDSGANINMGNNVVGGVADPLAATDAANKRYVDQEINKAFDKIEDNTEGIALAMAMSGLSLPSNKQFAIGVNFGFYDDKQAIAAQGALRLDDNFTLIGGFGAGLDDSENVGGRVGVQASF